MKNTDSIIIETSRLVLREFELVDAQPMYDLNSDPEVIRYTGDPPFYNVEAAKQFISQYDHYERHGFGRWAVVLKDTGAFIGWCGLKLNEENLVDLGFRFFKKEWNKGYATESAKASLNYGFEKLNLDTIVGRVLPENVASVKVLEKIGMRFWKKGTCHGIDGALYYRISVDQ